MRRLGHILEHAPNNIAQSLHGNRPPAHGAYLQSDPSNESTVPSYLQTATNANTFWGQLQPDATTGSQTGAAGSGWWPGSSQDHASSIPGNDSSVFWEENAWEQAVGDDDRSSHLSDYTDTDTGTSSDSGNEQIDMSDLANMTDAEAVLALYDKFGSQFANRVCSTVAGDGDTPAVLYRNDGDWVFSNVTGEVGLSGIGPTYQASWNP